MRIFQDIKQAFGVKIITDVHTPEQAQPVADVVDVIQLPAFWRAKPIWLKRWQNWSGDQREKPQFLSPGQMGNIVDKFEEGGNDKSFCAIAVQTSAMTIWLSICWASA